MRRIHWPYTARMNELMVKEFDMGLSAEAWVLLDMHHLSHYGIEQDDVNNTEELAVTVAASIVGRLMDQSMPVGLAVNGDRGHIFRPARRPAHPPISSTPSAGRRGTPTSLHASRAANPSAITLPAPQAHQPKRFQRR